jgi:GT2 family glycosyltransferase
MKIILDNISWTAKSTHNKISLHNQNPRAGKWNRIRVSLPENELQLTSKLFYLNRKKQGNGSHLLPTSSNKELDLIFFHGELLEDLELEILSSISTQLDEIHINLKTLGSISAIVQMMKIVSAMDRKKGLDPTRVYRKSWARWRRHGWGGFLMRLVREYHHEEVQSLLLRAPYPTWINSIEKPEFEDRETIFAALTNFSLQPLISIIIPIPAIPGKHLKTSIESIHKQSYANWELSLVCDSHVSSQMIEMLQKIIDHDCRIKIYRDPFCHPISSDIKKSPNVINGKFFMCLAPGDELAEHALFFSVQSINKHPATQIIYSDEDHINDKGVRFAPLFKPDWNPDLFFSQDYISRLCLFKNNLFTENPEIFSRIRANSGDHDLLLNCLHRVNFEEILHIPKILYHRRSLKLSQATTGTDPNNPPRLNALQCYFANLGRNHIRVEKGLTEKTLRVRYPIPEPAPLVSLIIPTRDKRKVLENCIHSILTKTTYPNFEILIIDNGTQAPDALDFLRHIEEENPNLKVLRWNHPFNYSAINNFGVSQARGDIIGLLNNDIEVITPDWLSEMVSHACRPEIGCVGAKLYFPDDTIQHAGVILGLYGVAGHSHKHFPRTSDGYWQRAVSVQNYSAVTGACLVVRREVFEKAGGLDEKNLPVAFNDVDFCLKVRRAGFRNLWTPFAELFHHESLSRGKDLTPEQKTRGENEIAYMKATWSEGLSRDPCYNPNLTHQLENFAINLDHILFPTPDKDEKGIN